MTVTFKKYLFKLKKQFIWIGLTKKTFYGHILWLGSKVPLWSLFIINHEGHDKLIGGKKMESSRSKGITEKLEQMDTRLRSIETETTASLAQMEFMLKSIQSEIQKIQTVSK